jgi:hypothetical protein
MTMTTTNKSSQTAQYKGHSYRVLYIGQTKYGRRARLQFFDGSKDFWVDAGLVSIRESLRHGSGMVRCQHCGNRTPEGDDWCMACGRSDYER